MKTNVKAKGADSEKYNKEKRLAGGAGMYSARQTSEALLRRAVLANVLWEDLAYERGDQTAANIAELIPRVNPATVAAIAIEARWKQHLRHIPLFIACEMATHDTHKHLVGDLLPKIIGRPDEITEFVALYWKKGKRPLSAQIKKGLRAAFALFDEYQFAKYNGPNQIRLRDVMFLVHPKAGNDPKRTELYRAIADDTLSPPDTWEVALSAGDDKKATWERLILERRLGALAFLRNLNNMEKAHVDRDVILTGFSTINPQRLLPLNYIAAAKAQPRWQRQIEDLMLRQLGSVPKLKGSTILIVDVSGSMKQAISHKSDFTRLDAANAMAIIAAEICERVTIYATAGDDRLYKHATQFVSPVRGFALADKISSLYTSLGGGGIFTRQCLEYIGERVRGYTSRIIVFSDSQDCDRIGSRVPRPFGRFNYIVDVSSHARGINYDGIWTAEITGWSQHFLTYIAHLEQSPLLDAPPTQNQ